MKRNARAKRSEKDLCLSRCSTRTAIVVVIQFKLHIPLFIQFMKSAESPWFGALSTSKCHIVKERILSVFMFHFLEFLSVFYSSEHLNK